MEFLKGRGDFFALIAILLIIFTWLKTDLTTMRADTKADIARVEAKLREIRGLIVTHIASDYKGHNHNKALKRSPATEGKKSE